MSFGHRGRSVTWSRSKNILKGTRTGTRRSSPGEFWRPSRFSGRNLKWDGPAAWLEPGNSWCRARHTSFHTGSGASGWSCSPCSMDAGNGHEDFDLGISAQPCDSHRGMSRFVVIDGVSFRQHPLMQDAGNENASRLTPEKHDVPALFHAAQARANAIAGATPEDGLSASLCNTLQGRRYNAGSGLCPTYAGCRRRYPSGRHRQGGINGMQPTASASSREA